MMVEIAPSVQAQTPVALFAKNSGLADQLIRVRERYRLSNDARSFEVRGEDVPLLVNELAARGRPVVGFTGDDLVDEWLAAGNVLDERLRRRRIAWYDPNAVYGAPALCLIGASPDILRAMRPLRVVVCSRYRNTTERFLAALRDDGMMLESLPIQGSLETCVLSGVAELIVDIVVSGRTVRGAGLQVLRVIGTSDIAVLESQ